MLSACSSKSELAEIEEQHAQTQNAPTEGKNEEAADDPPLPLQVER